VKARVDFVDPAHPAQGDPAGHGTHVAGIVAASRTFASPGMALDANLVSVRVLDPSAADESRTSSTSDDVVPSWSSEGPTADGVAKPDVVAPGRTIVSVRVPGSTLDQALPTHVEGLQTFRLSGTSEAAAVTAGAAALLAAQDKGASPDQIKALLVRNATRLSGASVNAQGAGEVNVARALHAPLAQDADQNVRPANGLLRLLGDMEPRALEDGLHVNWDHVNWDHVNWDHVNWDVATLD
jgi:serine protease AprX